MKISTKNSAASFKAAIKITISPALFFVVLGVSFAFMGCAGKAERSANFEKVSTFAGIPQDESGAVIKEPFGLASDGRGNLFISDGEAGRIWMADKNGALKLVTSKVDTPSALALDKNGSLYVADSGAHVIKKIDVTNDEASIVAGVENKPGYLDGDANTALFNAPVGIAVDESGKIFVADTYNDRIRVIENGKVSTLAGGEQGFADSESGGQAKFNTPCGIAVTAEGEVLVADTGNARIRLIDKAGRISTFAGGGGSESAPAALPLQAVFAEPVDVKIDARGVIYIADAAANTIYAWGRHFFPFVEKLNTGKRGLIDSGGSGGSGSGPIGGARFNRPTGIAFGENGELFVADSENQLVRVLQNKDSNMGARIKADEIGRLRLTAEKMRAAAPPRWPYEPPERAREVAGTMGEVRGEIVEDPVEEQDAWFHNGLDIVGGYGETARFVRPEKVLRPVPAQLFNTLRENLRLPTIGYIHLRLGRDRNNEPFGDPRFQFGFDPAGKMTGVRIRRGTKFSAGEPIGTLNSMNHVHLIAGRSGSEINALAALALPGIGDSIAPVIEEVHLYGEGWARLGETQKENERINVSGKLRIVARAYDRMNGNAERRRLGVFRLGYRVLHEDGTAVEAAGELNTFPDTILFDALPDGGQQTVPLVYGPGSKSGATGETIFNYIVTNVVRHGEAREDFFDTAKFAPGKYILRVFAADFFGNETSKDIKIGIGG